MNLLQGLGSALLCVDIIEGLWYVWEGDWFCQHPQLEEKSVAELAKTYLI